MKGEKSETKRFKCSVCSTDFNLKTDFFRHYMSHRSQNFSNITICNICSYNCTDKDDLESHLLIHKQSINTTYNCKKCNRKFVLKRQFEYHNIRCKAVTSLKNGCESGKSLSRSKVNCSEDFSDASNGADIAEDCTFNDDFEDHEFQFSITQTFSGRTIKTKKFHDSDDSDKKHQKQTVANGCNTAGSEYSPKRFKPSVSTSCLKIPYNKESEILSPPDVNVTEHQTVPSGCNNLESENSPKASVASISSNGLKVLGKELKILSPKLSTSIYKKCLEDGFVCVSGFSQPQNEGSQPAKVESIVNNSCNELLGKERNLSESVNSENFAQNEPKSTRNTLSKNLSLCSYGKTVSDSLNPMPRQKKINQTLPSTKYSMVKQNTHSHVKTLSNSSYIIPSQNEIRQTLPTNMNYSMTKQNALSSVLDQNFFIRNKHLICAGKEVEELIVSSKSVTEKLAKSKQSKMEDQHVPYVCNRNNQSKIVKNVNFGDQQLQIVKLTNPSPGNVLPYLADASKKVQTLNHNGILHSYLLSGNTQLVKVTPQFLNDLRKTTVLNKGNYNIKDGSILAKQSKSPVTQSVKFCLVEKSSKTLLPKSIINSSQDNVSSLITSPIVGENITSASSNNPIGKSARNIKDRMIARKRTELSVEDTIKFVSKSTKPLSFPEPIVNSSLENASLLSDSPSIGKNVISSSSKNDFSQKSHKNTISTTQNLKLQGIVKKQTEKVMTQKRIEKRETILNRCLFKLRERDRKKREKFKHKKKLKCLEKLLKKCHNRLCDDSCVEYLPPELSVGNNLPMVDTSSQTDFIAEVDETAHDDEIDPYANISAENQEKHSVKCTCNSKDCDWSQHTMEEDKLSFVELTDELTLKSTDLIPGSSGNVHKEIPDTNQHTMEEDKLSFGELTDELTLKSTNLIPGSSRNVHKEIPDTNQTLVDSKPDEQDIADKMLSINEKIKKNLSVSHTNVQAAINAMNELEDLDLTIGMWKKSLVVLKTIKACKKYKSNEAVRQKAKCIYEIFKKFYLSQSS